MTNEPTAEPINEDDNLPATKGDVHKASDDLAGATQEAFEDTAKTINALNTKVDGLATKQDVERILNEFKVVAENIHKDVAGANKDEITLIKDQQLPDHEDRIHDLEKHVGIPEGPRFEHAK